MGSIYKRIVAGCLSLGVVAAASSVALAEEQMHDKSQHLVDLTEQHWCYNCTVAVIDQYGIMNGFQDHTFRGDWTVNRYELAAAVAKTYNRIRGMHKLNLPAAANGKARSIGILPDHWAYQYVRKLAEENNLLSRFFRQIKVEEQGIQRTATTFDGDKVLTRKELAYALSEFLQQMEKASGKQLAPERRTSQLAIDHDVRSPYQPDIELALNRYQFMNLHADHTFRPDEPVTRYGLAAALCKVFELFPDPVAQTAEKTIDPNNELREIID